MGVAKLLDCREQITHCSHKRGGVSGVANYISLDIKVLQESRPRLFLGFIPQSAIRLAEIGQRALA